MEPDALSEHREPESLELASEEPALGALGAWDVIGDHPPDVIPDVRTSNLDAFDLRSLQTVDALHRELDVIDAASMSHFDERLTLDLGNSSCLGLITEVSWTDKIKGCREGIGVYFDATQAFGTDHLEKSIHSIFSCHIYIFAHVASFANYEEETKILQNGREVLT